MKISLNSIKNIIEAKINQAERFIGSEQGAFKLEYAVNAVLSEIKKLPLPLYIRVSLVIFEFAVKSELRKEIQKVFDEARNQAV